MHASNTRERSGLAAPLVLLLGLVLLVCGALLGVSMLTATPASAANAPTVTGVSPSVGPLTGGTAVTITGTDFVGGASVTFNGVAATGVTVVSATSITATTPAGVQGPAVVAVTNTDTQSGTLNGAFTYLGPPPTIGGIAPNTGSSAGATTVVITGHELRGRRDRDLRRDGGNLGHVQFGDPAHGHDASAYRGRGRRRRYEPRRAGR